MQHCFDCSDPAFVDDARSERRRAHACTSCYYAVLRLLASLHSLTAGRLRALLHSNQRRPAWRMLRHVGPRAHSILTYAVCPPRKRSLSGIGTFQAVNCFAVTTGIAHGRSSNSLWCPARPCLGRPYHYESCSCGRKSTCLDCYAPKTQLCDFAPD